MVIKSPFKDYYDFVAYQYGGGDPRLVYARNRITSVVPDKPWKESLTVEIEDCLLVDPFRYNRQWPNRQIDYLYLVITGKAYLLARPYSYLSKEDISTYRYSVNPDENIPLWRRHNRIEFGKEYPFLVELCRKVKSPVFAISEVKYLSDRRADISICGQCPILGRLGIPALIDPYQMYQDISMFMGNKMKETPDTKPPVELSNKQKILKAGFDLVRSFRHRI